MFDFRAPMILRSLIFVAALVASETYGLDLGKNANNLCLAVIGPTVFHL